MFEDSPSNRARAYYFPTAALAATRRLTEPERLAVAAKLSVVKRQRGAAETLFSAEFTVDALHLAAAALASAQEVIANASGPQGPDAAVEVLCRWGVGSATARDAIAVCDEVRALTLPATEDALEQSHVELFERVMGVCRLIERTFEWVPRSPVARVAVRSGRAALTLAALACVGLYAQRRARNRPIGTATASETYGEATGADALYRPSNVLDHQVDTEWLLPDNKPGWLEVRLRRPRDVTLARVLNAHNGTHNDRATREFRIELFAGETLVKGVDGVFMNFDPHPTWVTLEAPARGVTRIRFLVRSNYGNSGGLAELSLE